MVECKLRIVYVTSKHKQEAHGFQVYMNQVNLPGDNPTVCGLLLCILFCSTGDLRSDCIGCFLGGGSNAEKASKLAKDELPS